jgi:exonuclease SbcC
MRPLELTLKGFKGVRSGLNRVSITIDLRPYRGLVAIMGDNGRGKSTIKGNLHPYRIMPDRVKKYSPKGFSFYEECFGSDARKELLFEVSGIVYRSLVLIDADRRKQEAYLYRMDSAGQWQVFGNTQDGKLDVYDMAVEELLGTPRMFFTSIFRSQKAPSLSSYTRAEMMDIFAELIQVDEHREKKETAGDVADALLLHRKEIGTQLTNLMISLRDADQKHIDKGKAEERLAAISLDITSLDGLVKQTEGSIKEIELKISLQDESVKRIAKLEGDIQAKRKQAQELTDSVKVKKEHYNSRFKSKKTQQMEAEELIKKAPELRKRAEQEAAGIASADVLKKEIQQADALFLERNATLKAFGPMETRIKELESTLRQMLLTQKHVIETAQKDLDRALASAAKLGEVPCGGMDISVTCKFVKDAVVDRESLARLQKSLENAKQPNSQEPAIAQDIADLQKQLAAKPEIEKQEIEAKKRKDSLTVSLQKTEKDLAAIREDLKLLGKVEEAEKSLPLLSKELEDIIGEGKAVIGQIEKQAAQLNMEAEGLSAELKGIVLDGALQQQMQKLTCDGSDSKAKLEVLRKEEAGLRASVGALTELLKQAAVARVSVARLSSEIEVLDKDISEWQVLEKAMEGIITLEIDDAGPTVTAITNDILLSCYGPRFSVNIKTQDAKIGGDRDMKEVFDIVVYDSERNESKSLSVMSGGEETWIDDACELFSDNLCSNAQ